MTHLGNCQSSFPFSRITGWGLLILLWCVFVPTFIWLLSLLP